MSKKEEKLSKYTKKKLKYVKNSEPTSLLKSRLALEMYGKPIPDHFIERVGEELVEWAVNDPDALKISQFVIFHRFNINDFRNWSERNEKFRNCYALALEAIGNRRELGGMRNQYNERMIAFMMPYYDKDWKDMVTWRESMKQKNNEGGGNVVIKAVFDTVPDSTLVPHKQVREEGNGTT